MSERLPLFTNCLEEAFSETRMQLVEILCPWPLGAPDPEKVQERMGVVLEFAREGLGG